MVEQGEYELRRAWHQPTFVAVKHRADVKLRLFRKSLNAINGDAHDFGSVDRRLQAKGVGGLDATLAMQVQIRGQAVEGAGTVKDDRRHPGGVGHRPDDRGIAEGPMRRQSSSAAQPFCVSQDACVS